MRSTNAGHVPPLLVGPHGGVQVLRAASELLVGVRAATSRTDHVADLPPGATVLMYTDGLVEGRAEHLADGIERLVRMMRELAHLPLEPLVTEVVRRLVGASADDDTVLLGARPRG